MLRKRSTALFAAGVLSLLGLPLVAAGSARADILIVSDVAASVSAPAIAPGSLTVVGTIRNSGTLSQPAGSKLTYTPTGGTITSAPGCTIAAGTATCTVGGLAPGTSVSLTFGVTANSTATSVASVVKVTAAQLETNVLDPTNNTASAVTSIVRPYSVDAALSNNPTDVHYAEDTLLTLTASNPQTAQTVNVALASGGVVDGRIALPAGCTASGANVNCSFALGAASSKSFDVAVTAPNNGTGFTSTLTVTGASGGSKSVSVTTTTSPQSQAFVPSGDSLTYSGSNQTTTFKVPAGSTQGGGTFLTLREVNLEGTMCGTQPCIKQAAEAVFPGSGPYSGQDVTKPFIWEINYNERQVCNGGGNGCLIDVYWIPTGGTVAQPMALCTTDPITQAPRLTDINAPCLVRVDKTVKGFAKYTVAVLRDIVIPIISGGKLL